MGAVPLPLPDDHGLRHRSPPRPAREFVSHESALRPRHRARHAPAHRAHHLRRTRADWSPEFRRVPAACGRGDAGLPRLFRLCGAALHHCRQRRGHAAHLHRAELCGLRRGTDQHTAAQQLCLRPRQRVRHRALPLPDSLADSARLQRKYPGHLGLECGLHG